MFSTRNPDGDISLASSNFNSYLKEFYIPVLLASGFRQKDDIGEIFSPCPLGTFTDPSAKGEGGCQNCPPGNLLV